MERIDVNFAGPPNNPYYNRHQILLKYTTALRHLAALAEQYHVRPFHFDNYVVFQYFQQSNGSTNDSTANTPAFLKLELLNHILDRRRQILYWIFYILLAFLCVFVYRHETSSSESDAKSNFVYPAGMRLWRQMTLPLIKRFPRLTELHDESCLMENPFFQLEDLSCDPCAHVERVLDMTQNDASDVIMSSLYSRNSDETSSQLVPFVFKINQTPIEIDDFYNIYASNREIFRRDAFRIHSTNREVTNLEELFNQFNHSQPQNNPPQTHNMWRINRMLPARLLRQLLKRPGHLPSTGIALERYMAIDTEQAPAYYLPDTKCANVYIQQMLGTRFIILRPTSECRQKCHTLSMRLPQSFVLSYNWWYWKPISAPDPVADTYSISLIGSYC